MRTTTFTPEDFEIFKARVLELVDKFAMHDWHITVLHEQIGSGVSANTQYDTVAKNACFRLTIHPEGDYGIVWDVERLATHEMLHLLLADFCTACCTLHDPLHAMVVGAEHAALNRLMRVI
jgi:hypothetical protein